MSFLWLERIGVVKTLETDPLVLTQGIAAMRALLDEPLITSMHAEHCRIPGKDGFVDLTL